MVFTTEDYLQLYSIMFLRFFFCACAYAWKHFPRFRRHSSSFAFSIKGRTRKKIELPSGHSRHAAGSKSRKKNGTDKVTRDCLPFSCRVITPRRQYHCNYRIPRRCESCKTLLASIGELCL